MSHATLGSRSFSTGTASHLASAAMAAAGLGGRSSSLKDPGADCYGCLPLCCTRKENGKSPPFGGYNDSLQIEPEAVRCHANPWASQQCGTEKGWGLPSKGVESLATQHPYMLCSIRHVAAFTTCAVMSSSAGIHAVHHVRLAICSSVVELPDSSTGSATDCLPVTCLHMLLYTATRCHVVVHWVKWSTVDHKVARSNP